MVSLTSEMYMVRGGRGGGVVWRFLRERVVYIGWGFTGEILPADSKESIRRRVDEMDPTQGDQARHNIVGMLRRFCCEMRVGDVVVTYDPKSREYLVGIVRSDAEIRTTVWEDGVYEEDGYVRRVEWIHVLRRDDLSDTARRGLGGGLSCWKISGAVAAEIAQRCVGT